MSLTTSPPGMPAGTPAGPSASTMRRDIASAYLVTASRIFAWVIVSALVYRRMGKGAFALLTLVRSTVGLLGYTSLGLAPAMIAQLAQAMRGRPAVEGREVEVVGLPANQMLEQTPRPVAARPVAVAEAMRIIYSNGLALVLGLSIVGLLLCGAYGYAFSTLHRLPRGFGSGEASVMVWFMGAGVVARIISDVPAAVLQTRDRIALDNLLLCASEAVWVIVSAAAIYADKSIAWIGVAFCIANLALLLGRLPIGTHLAGRPAWRMIWRPTLVALLAFGSLVALAELADFLYAPTDYILINRLLRPIDVATYAPAVQIDGALLLMVLAVADVLLPKTALAHHAGKRDEVRRYYFRGTFATAGILAATSVGAYFTAPLIFKFWLGDKLLTTRVILPLVLIHTVIGGSSAVGRAILLGMGKVRAFTAAVLIAGVSNVILSFCFVRYCHWGLRGIILGTIVAVVGRCGVWMPWYVVRTLNRSGSGEVEFATLPAAGGPF